MDKYIIKWQCINGEILHFDIANSLEQAKQIIISAVDRLNVDKDNFIIEKLA